MPEISISNDFFTVVTFFQKLTQQAFVKKFILILGNFQFFIGFHFFIALNFLITNC